MEAEPYCVYVSEAAREAGMGPPQKTESGWSIPLRAES